MTRFLALLFLLSACWLPSSPASASAFRGLWVSAWESGIKTPEQVDRLVQRARDAGLTDLIVQVRKRSDAYYDSDLVPKAVDVPAEFDPLDDLLRKAHAEGIKVHAWLVMLLAHTPRRDRPPHPDSVLALNPDWVTFSAAGRRMGAGEAEGLYLDPGLPEVQRHLVAVAKDLVERYAVDGVNLDYIRYPSRRWGYHPRAVWRYRRETGKTTTKHRQAWDQWRRDQVSEIVQRVYQAVKGARPEVQVSADVWASLSEARGNRLQDWEHWLRKGWVDFVAPMNYTADRTLFATRSAAIYKRNGTRRVHMGVIDSPHTLAMADKALSLGGSGLVFYHYAGLRQEFWDRARRRWGPPLVSDASPEATGG